MVFTRESFRLFGIDLASAFDYFRAGWSEAMGWPALAWLSTPEPVRVIGPDGSSRLVSGLGGRVLAKGGRARFFAIELPESLVLHRQLRLPRMSASEMLAAVALEVGTSSPFPEADLAWGYRVADAAGDRQQVDVSLCSRSQIQRHVDGLADAPALNQTEVWAGGERPVVIQGYGEALREKRIASSRRRTGLMLLVALLLLVAVLLTPALQAVEEADRAQRMFDGLAARAAPQIAQREELVRIADTLKLLEAGLATPAAPLGVLAELTRQLPDDTALNRLELRGPVVRMSGRATDAAALMKSLGKSSLFGDVRAPSASARARGGQYESFTIELNVIGEAVR